MTENKHSAAAKRVAEQIFTAHNKTIQDMGFPPCPPDIERTIKDNYADIVDHEIYSPSLPLLEALSDACEIIGAHVPKETLLRIKGSAEYKNIVRTLKEVKVA